MQRRSLLAILPFSALLGACATTPAPTTVADTVARQPQLTTVSRLIAEAGLADTLRGPGPFTLFAPSDEAFKALPAATLANLSADKSKLAALLGYHVLAAKVASRDVKMGNQKTLEGGSVALAVAGPFVTVEDALVQTADIGATNGTVHIIDRVLKPPKR